jgi:hypothetical protein
MTPKKNRYQTLDKLWKLDDEQLKTSKHDDMLIWLLKKNNLKKIIIEKTPEASKWDWKNVKIHAEEYIIAENGYRVGAPDIMFSIPHYICNECNSSHTNKDYCPSCESKNISPWRNLHEHHHHYYKNFIEIKPKINNFGATLRQLKLYLSYGFEDRAYLLTEDLRYKKEFESQGIKVLSPNQTFIKKNKKIR